MEIRKNIKNHFFLFYLLTVAICFVLGYVLLVSLDKISNPTISELYVSIYPVITQFGMLIFPVLIIQSFVSDYKNKNILFYKLMGYNWLRYFLTKIAVILAWMSIIVFGGVIGISIVYQDFSYTLATLFYFESAIIYEILLASMWGFLFKSVIGAYVVNFAFWLFSMVASIANPKLSFLVRYDASNPVFIKFNQYFNTRNSDYLMIQENILYSIALFATVLCIIFIFRRRWEKMEFKGCGILLTENCNARCKMCCDSRGLVRGKTLTIEELDLILKNIKECPSIDLIGVTGGEPMLYPDLVEHIINFDYGRKVGITIKTNGFWGKDINKARNFIERNKSKIKMISFSYDQFHKEFIDLQNILNIVDIANDLEVSTEIVGCFLKDGIQPGDIINEMGEHAFKTNYAYQPVINTGSAEIFSDSQFIKVIDLKKHEARCIGLLDRTLLINAKLEVYPCCSQVVENTLLLMGNLHEESLSAIIQSIDYNKVLHKIYTEGFTPFLELLKKKNIEYPQSLTSPCELCGFLFKDDWFLRLLKEEGYFENI